jgi:hypothetical protein
MHGMLLAHSYHPSSRAMHTSRTSGTSLLGATHIKHILTLLLKHSVSTHQYSSQLLQFTVQSVRYAKPVNVHPVSTLLVPCYVYTIAVVYTYAQPMLILSSYNMWFCTALSPICRVLTSKCPLLVFSFAKGKCIPHSVNETNSRPNCHIECFRVHVQVRVRVCRC